MFEDENPTDFAIIHFNGEGGDDNVKATAIEPISERAKKFMRTKQFPNAVYFSGVYLLEEYGMEVINWIEKKGFSEATFFVDTVLFHLAYKDAYGKGSKLAAQVKEDKIKRLRQ